MGKSNAALNLAIALSSLGQRVVIIDADLGMANVEVLLGITPRYTLYDFLYHKKDLNEILTPGPGNIRIISGGVGLLELANLDNRAIKRLRDSMYHFDSGVDVVLVDTGAGINKNVLAFVGAAQEVIIVVTPEPTSITDAYGLIKVLASYNVHNEVNVLVNRAAKRQEAGDTFYKLKITAQHYLPNVDIKYLGSIPEDKNVIRAVKDQRPFVLYQPATPASRAVRAVAEQLAGGVQKERGGFFDFFSRLTRLFN
ncbi:flagellar biosynthesis protein FlhG [Desulfohalotomaculum tongense]|nr:flagellar biosynthesis protein FlhG [Desulforadius tongensis]